MRITSVLLAWVVCALTATPLLAAPTRLPFAYRLFRALSSLVTPVPLIYANATREHEVYDAMTRILAELTRPDDHLVLINPDGRYCAFRITADQNAVPLLQASQSDPTEFSQFASRYQRVWVVLDNPQAGWQAQPPATLAPTLAAQYMQLPLPLPTYFADASFPPGSTNFWLLRAHLLQRIAATSPAQLNPRFFLDLAQTYRRYGDLTNTILTLQKGLDAFPTDPYLARRLAETYFDECKDYRQAIHYNRLAARNFRLTFATPMYEALFNTALAYQQLGEDANAQLQFADILSELDQYPDQLWESRTRRYLGNLLLKMGNTNEAIRQFQLDLRLSAQHPGYSYDRLLGLFQDMKRADAYARTAHSFFFACGTNDVRALVRYLPILLHESDRTLLTNALLSARAWLARNPTLKNEFHRQPAWTVWTNLMFTLGFAPEL
ncbi:MAG: tetratricopeptide repeat protein [bacterium]|nr:tetratricopeptide repeat protein [bacterium]